MAKVFPHVLCVLIWAGLGLAAYDITGSALMSIFITALSATLVRPA